MSAPILSRMQRLPKTPGLRAVVAPAQAPAYCPPPPGTAIASPVTLAMIGASS